jgi:hypothetical protein
VNVDVTAVDAVVDRAVRAGDVAFAFLDEDGATVNVRLPILDAIRFALELGRAAREASGIPIAVSRGPRVPS